MAEKRKPISLKKTRGGAYQYGGENARKFEDILFKKFLNNPISDPNIMEKMNRLDAAHYASTGHDETGRLEKLIMRFAQEDASERRKKPKAKKPKKRPNPFTSPDTGNIASDPMFRDYIQPEVQPGTLSN